MRFDPELVSKMLSMQAICLYPREGHLLIVPMVDLEYLGEDVLVHLCKFLTLDEILKISSTNSTLHSWLCSNRVFHSIFVRRFGSTIPHQLESHEWKALIKLRTSKSLQFYTWGSCDMGRLGYQLSEVPSNHRSLVSIGVHTPSLVKCFQDDVIDQILSGGFSFQLLIKGCVYLVGIGYSNLMGRLYRPGPYQSDYTPPLESLGNESISNLLYPHDLDHHYGKFVSALSIPQTSGHAFITEISSGRMHILGLDNFGSVYSWDCGNAIPSKGVRIAFPRITTPAKKICAGWNMSLCQFSGIGLVYWFARESVSQENFENGSFQSDAYYHIVPNLVLVKDFTALANAILFINYDGLLYVYMVSENEEEQPLIKPLSRFNDWLESNNKESKRFASFSKVSGCYKSFSVFSEQGHVLVGSLDGDPENWAPILIPKLQNVGVIQVVSGDYHYLALTDKGELLSWGLELQRKGCLGLGSVRPGLNEDVVEEGNDVRVEVPMSVIKPNSKGKWLAATAGGWHSGGLFISDV